LTLPEELFGVTWVRRLRVGIPLLVVALLLVGSVLFVLWSQVVGQLLVVAGLWSGLMWFILRRGDPDGALGQLRRLRRATIAFGAALVAVGGALFVLVDQDLGLLLVFFGGAALALNLIGAKQEPLASPLDGPTFGDTPPYD
jgi:hypothetical protein